MDIHLYTIPDNIVQILLIDRTTDKSFNIDPTKVIPRYQKFQEDQKSRTKSKAEVFTPVSIVKKMNDSFDKDFKGIYSDYIDRLVLEVTCGEGPFLTTRYDASTGESILVNERVGLLDRKFLYMPKSFTEVEYIDISFRALKSTYGYEWQEDSLYLARRNVLLTTIENYIDRFNKYPDDEVITKWAEIISYNLFRMDGITMCIPETDIPAKVMNWKKNKMERFDGKREELGLW